MKDEELIELDAQGFIPGPEETEALFLARVERTQKAYRTQTDPLPSAHWEWVRHHLQELFGFAPRYLTAFYSNADLTPWQGAVIWLQEHSFPVIQLRTALRKGTYLGLYRREEVLAHEAAHAARCAFSASCFEEFFAYMTSERRLQRVLGPILARPWEVWPFFLLLLSASLSSWWIEEGAKGICEGSLFLALLWLFLGILRLIVRHRQLQKAAEELLRMGCSDVLARTLLFRLTDEEILRLGKGDPILTKDTLRERLLRALLVKAMT